MQAFTKEELNELFPNFINTGRLSLEELKKVTPEMRERIDLLNKKIYWDIFKLIGATTTHMYTTTMHRMAVNRFFGLGTLTMEELILALRGTVWHMTFPVFLAEQNVYGFLMDLDDYEVPGYRVGAPDLLRRTVHDMIHTPYDHVIKEIFCTDDVIDSPEDYFDMYENWLRMFRALERRMSVEGIRYTGMFTMGIMECMYADDESVRSLEDDMSVIPEEFRELLFTRKVLLETSHLISMETFLQDQALQAEYEQALDDYAMKVFHKGFADIIEHHFADVVRNNDTVLLWSILDEVLLKYEAAHNNFMMRVRDEHYR